MKKILSAVLVAIALSFVLFFTLKTHDNTVHESEIGNAVNDTNTVKIIIVPYFDPTDPQWNEIYSVADKYPNTIKYVIINPCSGPCGTSLSENWKQVISNLKNRGIKTLGYIFNTSESLANIDYYMKSQVPTDGIFFDNESSTNNLENFKQFSNYVHSLGGIVYINPGYNYPQVNDYITSGSTDIANIHEIESDKSQHISLNDQLPPTKLSVILGNVTSSEEMISKLTEVASKGIGTVYVYGDSYYNLPSFFVDEVRQASVTLIK
ncbi:MAG TPA: spherulation-specific family 4 protein [Candidatus Nitrosotalea sp.]|nr:spherulation-specific family 4 protein [Candidatus Nitrosotalea sp.]